MKEQVQQLIKQTAQKCVNSTNECLLERNALKECEKHIVALVEKLEATPNE
jgi:hypothetical protein